MNSRPSNLVPHPPSWTKPCWPLVEGFECLLEELDFRDSLAPLINIDETGKMECFSGRFIDNVRLLLGGPKTLVAAIAMKGEGFIQQVKQRPDCRLVII